MEGRYCASGRPRDVMYNRVCINPCTGQWTMLAGVTAAAPTAPPAADYCCCYHLLVISCLALYHAVGPPTAAPWPGCDAVPTKNKHKKIQTQIINWSHKRKIHWSFLKLSTRTRIHLNSQTGNADAIFHNWRRKYLNTQIIENKREIKVLHTHSNNLT